MLCYIFLGFSTAHLAAITQNCNAMKLISKGKGNINMPDGKSGRTPLHHAVERDDLTTVGYLILEVRNCTDDTNSIKLIIVLLDMQMHCQKN